MSLAHKKASENPPSKPSLPTTPESTEKQTGGEEEEKEEEKEEEPRKSIVEKIICHRYRKGKLLMKVIYKGASYEAFLPISLEQAEEEQPEALRPYLNGGIKQNGVTQLLGGYPRMEKLLNEEKKRRKRKRKRKAINKDRGKERPWERARIPSRKTTTKPAKLD